MKLNKHTTILLFIFSSIFLTGCLGTKARDTILLPSLQAVWPEVRIDAMAGTITATDSILTEFDTALATGDSTALLTLWPAIQQSALAGIQAGPAALQPSKVERLSNFSTGISTYAQRGGGD